MNSHFKHTICAIATPPGRGGVGVIRVSGPATPGIARAITGKNLKPRFAHFVAFRDAEDQAIDQGLALYFPEPNSFTGEDVLELQAHGGNQIMNALLDRVIELGARLANVGEFSERSFLNGKIDLLQAEAIADLIEANSEQAMRSAMRTLQGEFSRLINKLVEDLTRVRVHVEAAIDFSDEDIDILSDNGVAQALSKSLEDLEKIFSTARQGAMLKEGIDIVIVGKPNAGKSSLLNALAGQDSAIVTPVAGTTRDLLHERINIGGLLINITDSAGLRASEDIVEQEGVRRTRQAMLKADHLLLVIDASDGRIDCIDDFFEGMNFSEGQALLRRSTLIQNKIDLLSKTEAKISSTACAELTLPFIQVSALKGTGLELLVSHLRKLAGLENLEESVFVARQRHLDALELAAGLLKSAQEGLVASQSLELVAEDLRLAQRELGRITGVVTSDDLLGEIFSSFCLGK